MTGVRMITSTVRWRSDVEGVKTGVLLRKLYFSRYAREPSPSLSRIRDDIDPSRSRLTFDLIKWAEGKGAIIQTTDGWLIHTDKLLVLLEQDDVFALDYAIINEESHINLTTICRVTPKKHL